MEEVSLDLLIKKVKVVCWALLRNTRDAEFVFFFPLTWKRICTVSDFFFPAQSDSGSINAKGSAKTAEQLALSAVADCTFSLAVSCNIDLSDSERKYFPVTHRAT